MRQGNLFHGQGSHRPNYRGPSGSQAFVSREIREKLLDIRDNGFESWRGVAERIGISRSTLDLAMKGITSTKTLEKIQCFLAKLK